MLYKFIKKTSSSDIKNHNMSDQCPSDLDMRQLAEELRKPIIRKFKQRKVQSTFKDNIWGADLEDIHLISKCNKRFRFLLCVIEIYSKYAWVIPLKKKRKELQLLMLFRKF